MLIQLLRIIKSTLVIVSHSKVKHTD
jgi:hypothetical protein